MIRNATRVAAALLLVVGFGCGNSEEEAQQAAQAMAAQAQQQAAQAQQQAAQAQAQAAQAAAQAQAQAVGAQGGAGGSNFGTVSLNPGFVPDPHVVTGTSGGGTDASTLNNACAGWVSGTPDHLFVSGGNFTALRLLAHATDDITLVVQKPDGTYVCNDDTEGLDPIVAAPFPPGTYKIWVGSYQQGTNTQYRLGFTELGGTTAASLQ